ncbi:MAG: hypothetical protein ACFE0Q_06515 [Anaerolineae bacterium]
MMELRDFWGDMRTLFEGQPTQINEIDLKHLTMGSMADCITYLLHTAKDCNCRFTVPDTKAELLLPSPHSVVNYILQEQITAVMWLTFPAIPMLSVYVDYADTLSFGYVRGAWDAMAVLAFFDLAYELSQRAPGSQLSPSPHTFNADEQQQLLAFWQDYRHAS